MTDGKTPWPWFHSIPIYPCSPRSPAWSSQFQVAPWSDRRLAQPAGDAIWLLLGVGNLVEIEGAWNMWKSSWKSSWKLTCIPCKLAGEFWDSNSGPNGRLEGTGREKKQHQPLLIRFCPGKFAFNGWATGVRRFPKELNWKHVHSLNMSTYIYIYYTYIHIYNYIYTVYRDIILL